MDIYTCVDCKIEKAKTDFAPSKSNLRGIQSRCKPCYATYQREYYRKRIATDDEYRERKKTWRKERREKLAKLNGSKLREYLNTHPCVTCGEPDPIVLTFDHRDKETKLFNIGDKALRMKWEKILEEIEKCDVLCSNCHLRKTATQFSWYKYLAK